MCVVTNLDLEHLDCYDNLEDLSKTFAQFCNATPFYGTIALCTDSENVRNIIPLIKKPIVTYGIKSNANYQVKNIEFDKTSSKFDVIANNENLGEVELNVPGKHNIQNTLGAISIVLELEIPFSMIKKAFLATLGLGEGSK